MFDVNKIKIDVNPYQGELFRGLFLGGGVKLPLAKNLLELY